MRPLRRLLNLWRGESLARDFDDEIAFHLESRIAANVRKGMAQDQAAEEARRHFGSVLRAREGMREARVAEWIPAFGRDVRVAFRMARRQPALAALALLTLSLGVGATGAVFAFIDGMLIRPLPYADADRIVAVFDTFQTGPPRTGPTVPELLDLRQASRDLEAVSFVDWRDIQIGGGIEPTRAVGARAEPSLLRVLGVKPALGRLFTDADADGSHPPVAIFTDRLWRSHFAADPHVVGTRIVLNGLTTEVIGVLPASFTFDFFSADPVDVYVPFPMVPLYTSRAGEFVNVRRVVAVGRLKSASTVEQADAEVRTISSRLAAAHPDLYRVGTDRRDAGFAMRVEPLQEYLFARGRTALRLIAIAATLLLLIAAVNMGQFLLAQAVDRRAEMAMRSALGAARSRLACQLGAESLVVAMVAAAGGLLLAEAFIQLLRLPSISQDPFVAGRIELNAPVTAFTITIAAAVTLICNLVPLLRLTRSSPLHVLATREMAPPTRGRHLLLATQVAVTMTLLSVAGLLVHSITRLNTGDRGYVADSVTSIRLRAPLLVRDVGELYRRYLERLRVVPDISRVAMASPPLPLFAATNFTASGGAGDSATLSTQRAAYTMVSPDYFATLGIPLRTGRGFADTDRRGRPPVVIVNEELAQRLWPGQEAIGRELTAGDGPRAARMTVVGVVGNVRPALQLEPIAQVYVPYLQQPEPNMTLLVRPRQGRPVPMAAVKQAVWSVQPDQPLFDVRPLRDVVDSMTAEPRRGLALLLGTVAMLAVIVSGAGMFTLVTYVTTRRRREIALRRVIGAGLADVVRLVSITTIRWTCVGLAVGVAAAVATGALLRANFAGVAPTSVGVFAIVSVCYLAIAAAAMSAPAIGALRDDPAAILRAE
jgi:predicted permease